MGKSEWQDNLVVATQTKRRGFAPRDQGQSLLMRLRVRVVWGIFVALIAVILAKTIYLQGVQRGQYALTSANNHLELERRVAPRGRIVDRLGQEVPRTKATAPVVGYLSEVTADEIGCVAGLCYSPGMQIGRAGVEKVYESSLRGRDGGRLVERDAEGAEVRELGNNQAEAGRDLKLTIDSRLQEIMYAALGERI